MTKNGLVKKASQLVSSPFFQFVAQTAIALSGNPEIMKFSNSFGIVQAEFSNFVNTLLNAITENQNIDQSKINTREIYYFVSKTLKEVYFEDNLKKRILFKNLILSSLESVSFDSEQCKDYLVVLTQLGEKEILILKQAMINKSTKNGFINAFDYWEVFKVFEDKSLLSKEEYQSCINHLIGIGLMHHSQSSIIGGDISTYTVTSKGVGFFDYIKIDN